MEIKKSDAMWFLTWFTVGGTAIYLVHRMSNKLANMKFKLLSIGPEVQLRINEKFISIPASLVASMILSRLTPHQKALWFGSLAGFAAYSVFPAKQQKQISETEQKAKETYSQAKQELMQSGAWKFPAREFARYLAGKYNLPEHKEDVIASYEDIARYSQQIANVLKVTKEKVIAEYKQWQKIRKGQQ